ncbi:MAG: hypothetical protein ABI416_10785 [Ginsengibacter sp.]
MKIHVFLLIASLTSLKDFAQNYYVTKIQGAIYYNGALLKKGDVIYNLDRLVAESKDAALRLLDPRKGSIPISFASGQKIIKSAGTRHSELYELFVQRYINEYTSSKSMKTRGSDDPFDWFTFFNGFTSDAKNRMILIIEDQKIPLSGKTFKIEGAFRLYACTYTGKGDSLIRKLPVIKRSIVFKRSSFPVHRNFIWKLKIQNSDRLENDRLTDITNGPIEGNFFTIKELIKILGFFKTGWKANYESISEAREDCYYYLVFNYGRFYKPLVESYINKIFNYKK